MPAETAVNLAIALVASVLIPMLSMVGAWYVSARQQRQAKRKQEFDQALAGAEARTRELELREEIEAKLWERVHLEINRLNSTIDRLEKKVEQLAEENEQKANRIVALEALLENADARYKRLQGRFDEMLQDQTERYRNLRHRFDKMVEQHTTLQAEHEKALHKIAALERRIGTGPLAGCDEENGV